MSAREPVSAPSQPLLPARIAYALAAVSGALYFVGFAGFDIWPLAFVAFVPLLVALQGQPPSRAWRLGLLAGTVMNVGGFYWLLNMLKTFSGFSTVPCAFFTLVVCAYQGGRGGFTAWLYARSVERGWGQGPLRYAVFAGAFVAGEMLFPVLFPWYFAASVHQVPMFLQVADLGGPVLVGLVILAFNIAFAEWLIAKREARAPYKRVLQVGFAVPLLTCLYGVARIAHVDARAKEAKSVKVGLVQGNLGLMQKRTDPMEGLRRHLALTRELRDQGAELAVWSESSVTFAVPEENMDSFMRNRVTNQLGIPAIFGGVVYRVDPDRERWYNIALASNARGEITSRYDKHYLLMFGEYLPLGDTFPILYKWSPHSGKFTSGTSVKPLEVEIRGEKHRMTALICYEDILPGFTNDAVRAGDPELLVNITNDAWFGDTTEPWEHLALAKLRAVEHHRYLIRATNSGVSAVMDPVGRVVGHTKTFEQTSLLANVRLLSSATIYQYVGDKLWYLWSVVTIVFAFRKRRGPDAANPA